MNGNNDNISFNVGGKIFDIPTEKKDAFLSKYPDAVQVESFVVDKDTFDIPIEKVDKFKSKYSNAKPLFGDVKKKEKTEPTQEVQKVQVQETPTPVVSGVSEEPTPSPSVGQKPKKSSGYGLDLSKITPEIISLEEDEAISLLKKNYSQLGFHFEKAGIGDAVRVSRDGNEEVFDFDPWTSSGEISEAERLKKWMTENSTQDEILRGKHALKDYTDPSELQLNVSDVVPAEEKEVDSFDRAYGQFSGPSQKLMVSGVDTDAINELKRQKEEEAKKKEAMRMAVGKADGNVVQEVSGFEEGIAPGQDIIISNKIEAKKAKSSESPWRGGSNYYADIAINYLDETSPNQANDLRSRIENDKNFFPKKGSDRKDLKSPSSEVVKMGLDIALGVTQDNYVNASEKASGIVDQITELEPQLSQHLERIDGNNYNGTPEQFQEYSDLITQINQLSDSQEMRELRSSLDALNSTYRDYETNPDVNILDAYETIKDNYQRQVDAAYYKNSFISDILTPITDGVMRSGLGLVSNVTSFVNNLNADNEWGTTDDIAAWAKGAADTYDLGNSAPSEFSRDFYEEVAVVGDYEVELKGGKPTGRVFGSNGYLAQTDVSENILKQYNKDPELYDKETNWNVRSGLYTSTEVGLDMVMGLMPVAGVFGKGFKAIGASETLAATLGMSSAIVIQSQDEFVQMAKDAGANDQEALAFGMAQSTAIAAIAAINPIEAKALMRMTGASQKSLAKKYVQNIVGGMSRKDAAAEVTKTTLKSTISKLRAGGKVALKETERLVEAGVSGGKAVLKEAGKEGLEETLEIPAGDIISNGWQTVGGVNTYSEKDIAEYINTFFLAGAGSLPFAFLGLGGDAKTSSKKELTYSATQNIDTVRKLFEENIGKKIKDATGKEIELTQEYIDEHIGQLEELNKMSEVYFSNKNLTEADKIGITDLLSRKKSLESKAVDDVSKKAFQSTIDDIDASLNEYLNKGPKTPFYVINGIAMNKQQVEERLSDEDWVSGLKNGRFDVRIKNDKQMQERLNNVVNGKKQKGRLTKFSTPQNGIVGEVTYEDGTKKELTQEEYDALEKQEGLFDVETGTQPVAETKIKSPTEFLDELDIEGDMIRSDNPIDDVREVLNAYKEILNEGRYEKEREGELLERISEAENVIKAAESKKETVPTEAVAEESAPTEEVTVKKKDEVQTGKPLRIRYNKNPQKAPDMGAEFGQDVEASGDYVTQKVSDFTPEGFETGVVELENPLVIDITDDTQISYKNELSQRYDGKVGEELSEAIRQDGYDAIVTKYDDGSTGEIVLLKGQRDAIQEQAAGKVPVQPEAKPGKKMEEGKPQAEPEVAAEKGKEEVSEEEKVKAAKENLNNVWEKWKQSQKNLGVAFDPKSKANEDMELLEAFLSYIKALGIKTAKDIQKAFNDFTGGEATLDDAGAEFVAESVKEPVTKKTGKELSREVTFTNIYDIIEKVKKKTPKKANPKEVNKRAYEDAYDYLLKSDWFASATDTEQTEAIDDLKKLTGQRRESSPSAQKILGIDTTKEKISVDQKTVRSWMMQDLAKGYKLGKRDAKRVMSAMANLKNSLEKELVAAMREVQSSGKLSKKQVDAIVNKFQKTNVFNPDAVESFLNYMQKVVDKADHIEAINEANSTRKQIKRRMKNKDVDNNLVQAAKEFAKINPNKVDDIDAYNQLAAKIKEGLGFSMNSKQGVKFRSAFDISTVQQYSELELKRQQLASDAAFEEMFKEMFGSDFGMTVSEMRDFYGELENQDTVEDKENRAKLAMSSAVKAFDTYSAIINEMLESGIDSFTGEKLDIDENTKRLISEFMEIDIAKLSLKDAIRAVDALNNFVTNQTTGGLESIVRRYNGEKNVENLVKQGVRSYKLKLPFGSGETFLTKIVESYINAFASHPNLMDNLFGGVRPSLKVDNATGFSDVINGRAKAIKKANQTLEEFLDKFEKKEANGEDFNTAANMTERGLLGFMRRTVLSTDEKLRKAEFERRKNLVKESIEKMMKFGSEEDFDKAQIYMDAYNKLLEGSNSIEEVESKADPVNKEAVEWWSNKFNEILPELTETSINVYNTVLENESNYNPDVYKRLNEEEPLLTDLDEDAYNSGNGGQKVYDKKNPMLMRVKKPSSLPKGRYVSLDFDVNNFNSYQAALVDINTAASIQQLKGALESDAFMQLVPDYRDRKMLKERMTKYVAQIRGKGGVTDWKMINRISNIFARVGTATSLGGLLQPAKQTLPVFVNTLVNSGMSPEVFKSLAYVFDKDISNAINNSGMPIANRGAMSETTIDDIGKLSEKLSESKGVKMYELMKKGQDMWMKNFLQQPDAFIARASFLVFYKQELKKMGINPSEIDWKNHKWNKEAANYAQRMVDRQQNVSDTDLQGAFLSDQTGASPIIRKILLPFQNFVLNQKNRMYSDIKSLQYGSKEDKKIAAKSLFGLMAEWASFTIISIGIQEGMYMAAESIISQFKGDDDDEEAKKRRSKEKERRRQMYTKSIATSASKDFLSPLPVADEALIYFINKGLEEAGTSMDRGEFEFGVDFEKKVYEDYQKEILDIDDEEMKFEKSMYYLDEIVELQKEVDGEMYDVHRQKINEFNERFKSDMEYTKNIRQDVERYMKKIEKERKPFQLYESGKTKKKVADFLGSVGIAYDRMYKTQDMFRQAASLEYEQDMYGRKTVKKIPKELQNAMYIAAVAQLGSTLSVFPSEFASTSNKIQKLVQQQAKSESQLEAERKDEIKKMIIDRDEFYKGYESGMYSAINAYSLREYKKTATELTDEEIMDVMYKIGY